MATVTDPAGTGPELDRDIAAPSHIIRPRRAWPGSRATVGGLLVALAAIGLFSAFQNANAGPETRYVVTLDRIAPGTILTAEEHQVGGLGRLVAEVISTKPSLFDKPTKLAMIGINDRFGESGKPWQLIKKFGVAAEHIAQKAIELSQL